MLSVPNKKPNRRKVNNKNNIKNNKNNALQKIKKRVNKAKKNIRARNNNTDAQMEIQNDNINKKSSRLNINKRIIVFSVCVFGIFIALILRLAYLQLIDGKRLKEMSYNQSYVSQAITARRGTIYDSTGKSLAISAQVDTISINPRLIKAKSGESEDTEKLKKDLAKAFSEIFELNYEETLEKVNSDRAYVLIARKVENDKVDKLEEWMKENKLYNGINIDEDYKRYYPYGNLASNLIGFCGSDGQGLSGIEHYWNSSLTGTAGQIISIKDAVSGLIPNTNETCIDAKNGTNVTLTVDLTIQSITEKYLEQACKEYDCKNGGNVIVMSPTTGDILAMATYPNFNLNTPYEPTESIKGTWDSLTQEQQSAALQKTWRNKSVSDTYEPGSIFKMIIASIALEEGTANTDTYDYHCSGSETISGVRINCWKTSGHGSQTLRNALMNSCNCSFMQIATKLGPETLYKYFNAYGLFNKTDIQTSGETNSNFHPLENVGPIELATISFGQRFNITPIQMATAICSIANEGVMMKPRIVSKVENIDDGTVTTIEPTEVRRVISSDTASELMNMLESVVSSGTGSYGQVQGYSVAGKTGTSEPSAGQEETAGYVASFAAISPVENPEVVVLVTLYNPKGSAHQGGTIAAPVASQILTEVLPYLGVPSNETKTSTTVASSNNLLPDVKNKTIAEAKKILQSAGFTVSTDATSDSVVAEQYPIAGTSLLKNAIIKLYNETTDARVSTTVPNVKGISLAKATSTLKSQNLNIQYTGTGSSVVSQDILSGTSVDEGTVVNVVLKDEISSGH